MSGKARPSLRAKALENVKHCNLSQTDKDCIIEVFKRYEMKVNVVYCKDCIHWGGVSFGQVCKRWSGIDLKNHTQPMDYCSFGERKDSAE